MLDFNDAGPQIRAHDAAAWEARLDKLRAALRSHAREVVEHIFPRARFQANEARISDVGGARGESLSISLTGERAGLWFDHAQNEDGGDLIELWMRSQSCDFPTAVRDFEEWFGLGTTKPRFHTRVHHVGAERKAQADKEPKVDERLGAPVNTYHYLAADGSLLGIVRRYHLDELDGHGKPKKTFRPTNARGEPRMPDLRPLYRIPTIIGASQVVLVEGEKCADALETIGIEATTAMGGAKADPAKTDWSPLAGKTVLVWEDNDAAGEGLSERVRPSLEAIGCTVRRIAIPTGKPVKWDAADAVEAGEDVGSILAEPAVPRGRFTFLNVDELETMEPIEWLVDNVLPASGFIGLYGPSGGLKSFVAVDIGLHVATGREWHGKAVKQGPVIYVAGEGKRGLAKRVVGWRRAKADAPRPAFRLLPSSVAISTGEELEALIVAILGLGENPALIILDTLARNFGPGDENSQKDMNAFVRGVDRLIEAIGSAVMVVHHTGKDDNKGERGSSAFRGALDTSIFVRRSGRSLTLVNKAPHGKQKDADEFEDIKLYAAPVSFELAGADEKTLVLMQDTSVVIGEEDDDQDNEAEPAQRLGPLERSILTVLGQAATAGQGLGFTRIRLMIGSEVKDSGLNKALHRLKAKGKIDRGSDGWVLL